jgi:hypothetical protein
MTKTSKLSKVTGNLDTLTDEDLKFVNQLIQAILEAREDQRAKEAKNEEEYIGSQSTLMGNKQPRGCYEKKMINGCGPYLYLRWYSGKVLKSTYLGKAR